MESFRRFETIDVQLVGATPQPYETAVASARTCYSGKGVIWPRDVSVNEKAVELRDRIAASTLEAGHLSTRQHAHFTFALSGVSRHFLWSFLHNHPYYNSEQVSQRYVRVKPGNFLVPPLDEKAQGVFVAAVESQTRAYEELLVALRPSIEKEFYERFPARRKTPERWKVSIDKRVYEIARYALGVGTTAYLYHTVSSLTLLRYARLCEAFETPTEQKVVVGQMMQRVLELDPLFGKEVPDPVPLEKTLEYQFFRDLQEGNRPVTKAFREEFDRSLEGRLSKLVDYSVRAEGLLAEGVRASLGLASSEFSNEAALDLLLDPKNNPTLADTLGVAALDRLNQAFRHVHFTFRKKLSHTADSQDQRHRTIPGSRPLLSMHYAGDPDFLTPYAIEHDAESRDIYERAMQASFKAIDQLLNLGVKREYAMYLLPNSFPIRLIATGDLQALQHKWKIRSCYNAQEEIFRATVQEIEEVKALFPKLAAHLKAPCYLRQRAGYKPYCPEGDRFCGIPVWKLEIEKYERKSL